MELTSVVTPIFWVGFIAFVLAMLALDLFVLGGRGAHKVSAREALGCATPREAVVEAARRGLL